MSDNEEKRCPLCTEEMDFTDRQLKPCKCGYEICVWCWHHIMNEANSVGRCPACRSPYDEEKIVGRAANCGRSVIGISVEQKQKLQKAKWKASEGRKHLSSIRVIQRNLVCIIGFPVNLADEDLLKRWEYFGQYGKVLKVSISRPLSGFIIQHFSNKSCCVHIRYSKEEEAIKCIRSVHNFILDGRSLRACFGTSKYCYAWLGNVPCNNQDCLYLHDFGSPEDSFNKDDIDPAFITSMVWGRVQQILGVTNNMQLRSGNILPPAEECCIMSSTANIAKDPSNLREYCVYGSSRSSNFAEVSSQISPTIITSTGLIACLPTSKTNTKARVAPVPITRSLELTKESWSPSLGKDGDLHVDSKFLSLFSGLSSVSMNSGPEQEHSIPAVTNSSICIDLFVKKPRKEGSEQHDTSLFKEPSTSQALEEATTSSTSTVCFQKKEDLLAFDDLRLNDSESIGHPPSESSSHNVPKILNQSSLHSLKQNEICNRNILHEDPRILPTEHNEAILPFISRSSLLSNEFRTNRGSSFSESESTIERSNVVLDAGKDEYLGRFHNNVAVDSDVAQDMRESNIISNILSMDLDAWDNLLVSPHNLVKLLNEMDDQHGSFKIANLQKIQNCSQSRFSFARQEDFPNQNSDLDHSDSNIRTALNKYSAPQNFTVNKEYCLDRYQKISLSSSSMASEDRPSCSFTSSNKLSGVSTTPKSTPLGFSVPSQASPPVVFSQEGVDLPSHSYDHFPQKSIFRGGQFQDFGSMLSSINDAYGFPPMVLEQYEARNPSWLEQLTAQQFRNGYISNSHWEGWNEVNSIGDLGMSELLKNQRLGVKKFVPGYGDLLKFQISNFGNQHNRGFGM